MSWGGAEWLGGGGGAERLAGGGGVGVGRGAGRRGSSPITLGLLCGIHPMTC